MDERQTRRIIRLSTGSKAVQRKVQGASLVGKVRSTEYSTLTLQLTDRRMAGDWRLERSCLASELGYPVFYLRRFCSQDPDFGDIATSY